VKKKKVILFIGHTFDLAFFMRLIPLINSDNDFEITAIVAKGKYFREMHNLGNYLKEITHSSICIQQNRIPAYSRNIIKSLFNTFRLKRKLNSQDFSSSLLISLDKSTFLANYLLSKFKNVILIQTKESNDNDLKKHFRIRLLRTIWFNILNLLTNSKYTTLYVNKGSCNRVHQFRILKPEHYTIYRNLTSKRNKIILPSVANSNKSNKVLIFGSRFYGWAYFYEYYDFNRSKIISFYTCLHELYPNYEFLYKPHPKEEGKEFDEINKVFGGKLINLGISLNAEMYLLENKDIDLCVSINSTSSISAFEMGFNSKVFYKILKFPDSLVYDMDLRFNDAPNDIFITSLDADIKNKENRSNTKSDLKYIRKILDKSFENCDK